MRVRLVGRGLGNCPGCSAPRSQTRLPSLGNGKDSDSGAERGERRDGSAADDSSGSAIVTGTGCDAKIWVSLLSELRCLQKTTCERNTHIRSNALFLPAAAFPLTHAQAVRLLTKAPLAHFVLFSVAQTVLRGATCSKTASALSFICVCLCQDGTKACIVFKEGLKNTGRRSEIRLNCVYSKFMFNISLH